MRKWRKPSLATSMLANDLADDALSRLDRGDDIVPPQADGTPRIVTKSLIRLCANICALQTQRELDMESLLIMANDSEEEFEALVREIEEEAGKRGA